MVDFEYWAGIHRYFRTNMEVPKPTRLINHFLTTSVTDIILYQPKDGEYDFHESKKLKTVSLKYLFKKVFMGCSIVAIAVMLWFLSLTSYKKKIWDFIGQIILFVNIRHNTYYCFVHLRILIWVWFFFNIDLLFLL